MHAWPCVQMMMIHEGGLGEEGEGGGGGEVGEGGE